MSLDGVEKDDFAMIIGFPGQTMRYRSATSTEWSQNWRFPGRVKMFGDLLDIMNRAGENDPGVKIKMARFDAMLNNSMKNYEGQIEGFRKAGLLDLKIAEEKAFTEWVNSDKKRKKKYGDVLPTIARLYEEQATYRDKNVIGGFIGFMNQMTSASGTIYRWSEEKVKDDMDREPAFMERSIPRVKQRLQMIDMGYDEGVDKQFLRYFMLESRALPETQRIKGFDEMLAGYSGSDEEKIDALIEDLYAGTKLDDADERMRMFDLSREELMKEGDTFIDFFAKLYPEVKEMEDRDEEFDGNISAVRPLLIEGMKEWKGGAFYPDANGTIRLTYGTVTGYAPADAVNYSCVTRLGGVIEKNTGVEPFDCPEKLVQLWEKKDFGKYEHDCFVDVPVDFLSTCDITGGNSGSPIINGKGECIGAAFDGNWESISADYLFNSELNRCISVESRYILFVLDKFSGAYELLGELTIQ
jgi:hypothetical protein